MTNYASIVINDKVFDSLEIFFSYAKLLEAFHNLYDELKKINKNYNLLKKGSYPFH